MVGERSCGRLGPTPPLRKTLSAAAAWVPPRHNPSLIAAQSVAAWWLIIPERTAGRPPQTSAPSLPRRRPRPRTSQQAGQHVLQPLARGLLGRLCGAAAAAAAAWPSQLGARCGSCPFVQSAPADFFCWNAGWIRSGMQQCSASQLASSWAGACLLTSCSSCMTTWPLQWRRLWPAVGFQPQQQRRLPGGLGC